ncbi:MAG: efflux RND transporter periplasmic adaptor subunit [Candidatus Synoicihabitans palmerolidicus]|nr:efflux RND transporter periplasmic adaptor subunit [Candidatus Synoicihabitans palmerolidicus]
MCNLGNVRTNACSASPLQSPATRLCTAVRSSLAAGILLLGACTKAPTPPAAHTSAPPVEIVQAHRGGLPLVERLSGTIRADNQVILYPEVSGRIDQVLVENGDTVTVDQPLVRINDNQVREQMRQSEAGHRIAAARLRQAQARLSEADA